MYTYIYIYNEYVCICCSRGMSIPSHSFGNQGLFVLRSLARIDTHTYTHTHTHKHTHTHTLRVPRSPILGIPI